MEKLLMVYFFLFFGAFVLASDKNLEVLENDNTARGCIAVEFYCGGSGTLCYGNGMTLSQLNQIADEWAEEVCSDPDYMDD